MVADRRHRPVQEDDRDDYEQRGGGMRPKNNDFGKGKGGKSRKEEKDAPCRRSRR